MRLFMLQINNTVSLIITIFELLKNHIKIMKKTILLITVFIFVNTIIAQKSKVIKFPSEELGTSRVIKIYIPKSYEATGDRVYPLTIILDSEYLFDIYVANAKLFADKDKAPEQIIVGVTQNQNLPKERYSDCEYDPINSMPTAVSTSFYRFIRNELLNYMENNYRISPFKTIVGNTLTANFTNYFMIEGRPAFQAYVNLNPYFAPDILSMLHDKIPTLETEVFYYIVSGKHNGLKHKSIKDVNNLLKSSNNELFNYRFDEFNNSTKIASIGQGIAGSLAFTFDQYSAISKEEFKNKVAKLSPPEAIEYLERKYVEIEYLFGANIKIRERDIYAIEGIIMDKEDGDYLEEFGKMINRLYPNSPIGDYYIGRYYETGHKYKKALKYYKTGFAKIDSNDPNRDGYYQNVERILSIRKEAKLKDESPEEEYQEDEENLEEEKK